MKKADFVKAIDEAIEAKEMEAAIQYPDVATQMLKERIERAEDALSDCWAHARAMARALTFWDDYTGRPDYTVTAFRLWEKEHVSDQCDGFKRGESHD